MKLTKKRPEERVRSLKASEREQRFRYPATDEIAEISCHLDTQWNEGNQPADADPTDVAIAS